MLSHVKRVAYVDNFMTYFTGGLPRKESCELQKELLQGYADRICYNSIIEIKSF